MKVLLIDEDPDFCEKVTGFLAEKKCSAEVARTYFQAETAIINGNYDVLVISDSLDKNSISLELISTSQKKNDTTSYLVTAEHDSIHMKQAAYAVGADDYLVKPFHLEELYMRLKALYRRAQKVENNVIVFNEISVNLTTIQAFVNGQLLKLTPKEFEIFLLFLSNKNRPLSKDFIAESIWGNYVENLDNLDFIYQHIKNIKKKLKAAGAKPYIRNVYGMGYRFTTH